MKRLAMTLAMLALVAGCSDGEERADPAPEGEVTLTDEEAVVLFYEIDFWEGSSSEDLEIISEGICGVHDAAEEPSEGWLLNLKTLTDAGIGGEDAGASMAYAAGWKCPEHLEAGPTAP